MPAPEPPSSKENLRLLSLVARSSAEAVKAPPTALRAIRSVLPSAHSMLELRIAEELAFLGRRADNVRATLLMEAGYSHRHVAQLRELKQMRDDLAELARLVGTSERETAAEEVIQPELKSRLLARSLESAPRTLH